MTNDRRITRPSTLDSLLGRRDKAAEEAQVRYLSGTEKDAWAETEVPFVVKSVNMGEGEFGARWELVVRAQGDDEDRIMTISRNRARDPLMRELERLCRQNEQGPLVLDVVTYNDGRTFQWFKRPGVASAT